MVKIQATALAMGEWKIRTSICNITANIEMLKAIIAKTIISGNRIIYTFHWLILILAYAIYIITALTVHFLDQAVDVGLEAGKLVVELAGKLEVLHNSLVEALAGDQ